MGIQQSFSILLLENKEEDYEEVRRQLYLPTKLQQIDYSIIWKRSLAQGIAELAKDAPDLILLDMVLPDAEGEDSLHRLRECAADIPIVILSDEENEARALKLISEGAQDYVIKDEYPDLLARTILAAICRHEIVDRLEQNERSTRKSALAKSEFFSSMSHELRNPLTAIIGYSEALMSSSLNKQETDTALSAIYSNGRHLLQVINDVLDISKIEAGELKADKSKESLTPCLKDIWQTFSKRAKEKNIEFSIDLRSPLPATFETDFFRLKQILYNLVGNAVKFTAEGFVKLVVRASTDDDVLVFEVRDSGVGISEKAQRLLFKAFSQGEVSRAREFGGTGLGLVISSKLAQKLGGKLVLESREGIGSVFELSLPLSEIGRSSFTSETMNVKELDGGHSAGEDIKISGKVLVVDDMEDNRSLISLILKRVGLEVEVAENGLVALEKFTQSQFDLILLDMQMPVMDGREVARTLRAQGANLPIVAVTASVVDESIHECLQAGCDAWVRKPFSREELMDCVLQFLTNQERNKMAKPPQPTVRDDELAEVRKSFVRKLPGRLSDIEQALTSKDLDKLRGEAHRIIGAGLFGFKELSHLGSILESLIIQEQTGGLRLVEALVKKVRNEVGRISTEEKAEAPEEGTAPQTQIPAILVLDDDEVTLKVVSRILSVKGFHAAVARSTKEALDLCNENAFAIMLVALEMSDEKPDEAVQAVRKALKRTIPVVAMTGRLPSEVRSQLSAIGIEHSLLKPISRDQIFEMMDSLIFSSFAS